MTEMNQKSCGHACRSSSVDTSDSDDNMTKASSTDSVDSAQHRSLYQRMRLSSRALLSSAKSFHSPIKGSVRRLGSASSMATSASSILDCVGECSESAWKNQPTVASELSSLTAAGHTGLLETGANSFPWRRYLKMCFTVVAVCVHIYLMTADWHFCSLDYPSNSLTFWTYSTGTMFCVTLPFICWLFFEWIRNESSFMARQASWLFLFTWMSTATTVLLMVSGHGNTAWFVGINVATGKWALTILAIWARVSMAEKAFSMGKSAKMTRRRGAAFYIMLVLFLPFPVTLATDVPYILYLVRPEIYSTRSSLIALGRSLQLLTNGIFVVRFVLFAVTGLLAWWGLSRILVPLDGFPDSLKESKKFLGSEVDWAKPIVRRVRLALVLLCLFGSMHNAFAFWTFLQSDALNAAWYQAIWAFDPFGDLYVVADFFTLLMTVSCFKSQKPIIVESKASRQESGSHQSEGQVTSPDWQRAVERLAQRYITAGELLEFYRDLPTVMPHFDPKKHTMNDVVRAAIIPKSRVEEWGGGAYADLLERHRREAKPPGDTRMEKSVLPHSGSCSGRRSRAGRVRTHRHSAHR
mmetsp:Transcript_23787/g.51937  ORF Transcript_23787/g.51937 Transcript_23787/m.51937 type:complete len:580 (+) Transcript_23787:102-1841(+)